MPSVYAFGMDYIYYFRRQKHMESKKILGIIRNNLDEIAQPISELILLLRSLSEEIEEKDKIYPSIKIMGTQLDNILDIIRYIHQRT
jgi:hypothetical protein